MCGNFGRRVGIGDDGIVDAVAEVMRAAIYSVFCSSQAKCIARLLKGVSVMLESHAWLCIDSFLPY